MRTLHLALLTLIPLVLSCSQTHKKRATSSKLNVSYEEFQKILRPRSIVMLEGQNAFLTILSMPGDPYPKVYRYDLTTKEFSLDYDHGQAVSSLSQGRDGQSLYLHIDNRGDENTGIYIYDPQGKKISPLFVQRGRKARLLDTDESGQTLFITSNHQNKAIFSIYTFKLQNQQMTRISDGRTNLRSGRASPSGARFAATRSLSNNENQVFLIDVRKKKMRRLFKRAHSIFYPTFFNATETALIGISDYRSDRQGCAQISLNSPNRVSYLLADAKKDIQCAYETQSKTYLVYESFRGRSSMKLFKKMFSQPLSIPQIYSNQSVLYQGYDRSSQNMLLSFSAANTPGTLHTLNLKTLTETKVLDTNRSRIPREDLALSIDFDYKSYDGLPIHGIVYANKSWLTSGRQYPVVVWPHGGPDSYERHRYHSWFQYLALNGFIVFAPNYRGSTGYGKKFETLNDRDWGGGHIRDLVAGKQALARLPYIDTKNIFIFGGSFGGYSTLATVAFQPKAFKAAVGFIAIGNLFTFIKSIPPDEGWQTEFKREMGDPIKDKALYRERSPFFHIDKIETPLQIYQAENDTRTVKPEMDAFVAEMRKQGKKVDYTVLKDVGHSLARPETRKTVLEGAVRFFKSFIR